MGKLDANTRAATRLTSGFSSENKQFSKEDLEGCKISNL